MEIWLKQDNDAIQIPILPPSFEVTVENGHTTVNVQTRGEVSILGKRGLKTIELTSFFPAQDYPFAAYPKDREPEEYVKKIEDWLEEPVRLTITNTDINMECVIQSFRYGEPDGTGDVEYALSLQEYRPPVYTHVEEETKQSTATTAKKNTKKKSTSKRTTKKASKSYTVKQGDTLWGIAKNMYGSGSKESKIYEANKSTIEKAAKKNGFSSSSHNGVAGWWIFPGTKLVIP